MKFIYKIISVIALTYFAFGCSSAEPATPVQTLKAYTIAVKKKDIAMMKTLLSEASLKIHREQAKAQNVTLDEIIQRETLFAETQRVFGYKDERIEGDKATVQVKNDMDAWDTFFLVRENGLWKIDKKGFSDEIINQNEQAEREMDDQFEKDRQETEQQLDNPDAEDGTDENDLPAKEDVQPTPEATLDTPDATPDDAGDPSKDNS